MKDFSNATTMRECLCWAERPSSVYKLKRTSLHAIIGHHSTESGHHSQEGFCQVKKSKMAMKMLCLTLMLVGALVLSVECSLENSEYQDMDAKADSYRPRPGKRARKYHIHHLYSRCSDQEENALWKTNCKSLDGGTIIHELLQ
ncbi:hypothetical protein AC249_AIPGENE25725 [Exaiptasia diaphana]|nr:hypothetical protein AC249_AIPGENE25725 [Exaiptasia diaphana]